MPSGAASCRPGAVGTNGGKVENTPGSTVKSIPPFWVTRIEPSAASAAPFAPPRVSANRSTIRCSGCTRNNAPAATLVATTVPSGHHTGPSANGMPPPTISDCTGAHVTALRRVGRKTARAPFSCHRWQGLAFGGSGRFPRRADHRPARYRTLEAARSPTRIPRSSSSSSPAAIRRPACRPTRSSAATSGWDEIVAVARRGGRAVGAALGHRRRQRAAAVFDHDRIVTCARGAGAVPISEWVMAAILAWAKRFPETFLSRAAEVLELPEAGARSGRGCRRSRWSASVGSAPRSRRVRYAFGMHVRALAAHRRAEPGAPACRSCTRSTSCCRAPRTSCSPRPRPRARGT